MAWGFGKKEGQSDEDAQKELNTFIEKIGASFEAKLEAAIKPIREEVGAVKTKWDALEKAAAATDTNNDTNNTNNTTELTDEQKRELNDRKLLAITIATNARVTEGEILAEVNAQGLSEFIPKVKEYFANTPLERKGQADYPMYCRNIVNMVIGEAARSKGLRFDGQGKRFFLEDAAGKTNEGQQYDFLAGDLAWTDPRSGRQMSATEQLAKLGIKPEEFAESVKKGVV